MISKKIYKNIKYFIKKNTINNLHLKNKKIVKKINYNRSHINPNRVLILILLFCSFLFGNHLINIWYNSKNKNNFKSPFNIVPNSGIY